MGLETQLEIKSEGVHKLLAEVVGINSIFPNEQAIGGFLEKDLEDRGFNVERQEIGNGRANLLVQKGRNPSILFYGHMDTVPVAPGWEKDPFKPEEIDGKIYGLGASDMKGGVVAIIEAASNSQTPVKILLAVDEENEGEGAYKALTERPDFFRGINLTVSAEPDYGQGLNGITNARPGYSVFEVVFKGTPMHIFRVNEAIDAVQKLAEFSDRFYREREKIFKSPETRAAFKRVWGESIGMSVVGESGAEIMALVGFNDSTAEVLEAIRKLGLADEVKHKPGLTPDFLPYRFPEFPHRDILSQVIRQGTGKEMKLFHRASVGDDNLLATLKIPVLTWGPVGKNEHAPNENVELESVVKLAKMYKAFLDEVGKIDKPQPRNYLK